MTLDESSAETLVAVAPMGEAPAEGDWLTGAAEEDQAGAALDQNPVVHSQNITNPIGRAFLVLRVASAVSILCAFGVLFALETSQSNLHVWGGTGGFLVYLAVLAEVPLRWA